VAVTLDLRAGDVDAVKLAFESAGARLWRPDWNKWPSNCAFGRCLAIVDSEIGQNAAYPACSCVDAFFQIGERRGLPLLDLVE